jgi:hypothetical protein
MKMDTHPLIAAALAAPKTHAVVTTFADGEVRRFETRNLGSAENHAVSERRKIGRDLISRQTGAVVRVVSVEIVAIKSRAELAAEYLDLVGYDPFEDCPTISEVEVAQILVEYKREAGIQ